MLSALRYPNYRRRQREPHAHDFHLRQMKILGERRSLSHSVMVGTFVCVLFLFVTPFHIDGGS